MYDFYFGKKEDIEKDPKRFLLAIKRMLHRWCNSIPDSEYITLYDVLDDLKLPDKSVIVETGSGASTIVLCYFAVTNKTISKNTYFYTLPSIPSRQGRENLEFPEFLSAYSCKSLIGNACREKGSGSNEIISKLFHCSL